MRDRRVQGSYNHIRDLFAVYKTKLIAPERSVKEVCVVCVKEICGFDITREQVAYTPTTKTVTFIVPSIIRQELMMRKSQLLMVMEHKLGHRSAPKEII
jgi:hypothetical protein